MKITVDWTFDAKEDYWNNIEYLELGFTLIEVQKFMDEVDSIIKLLEVGNIIFKKSRFKGIYELPIVPKIQLYYRFKDENHIQLLRFWNNKKDPKKLKL